MDKRETLADNLRYHAAFFEGTDAPVFKLLHRAASALEEKDCALRECVEALGHLKAGEADSLGLTDVWRSARDALSK